MIPAEADLYIVENADTTETITIPGITDATGYKAAIDVRVSDDPDSTRYIGLTSTPAAGIVLSASSAGLAITYTITETQADTHIPAIKSGGARWSLKVTDPTNASLQYARGKVVPIRTATE